MNESSAAPTESPPATTDAERLFAAALPRQSAGDAAGAIAELRSAIASLLASG